MGVPVQKDRRVLFAERILEASKANQIAWEPLANNDSFTAAITGFVVQVHFSSGAYDDSSGHWVRVANVDGQTVEIIDDDILVQHGMERGKALGLLQQLYVEARRKAMNADDILDAILGKIGKTGG
jgi:hypothetical protein